MGSTTELDRRCALVIAIDGLRASALGTYGNTSYPTPHFDELASRSLVVDWLLGTSPTLESFYQGAWADLGRSKARRWLFSDDNDVVQSASESSFDKIIAVEAGASHAAADFESTHAAGFFARAVEQLAAWLKDAADQQTNGLLWVHFSGLSGPWDAPLAARNALLDEDDPPAPEFVTPPAALRDIVDPDELLGYRVAYAAQVGVIEMCLYGLLEAFDAVDAGRNKLAMVVGTRGFPLGEHGCIGLSCNSLYSEQLHVPWLVQSGDTRNPLPRITGFAQPVDVCATLCDWLSGNTDGVRGTTLLPHLSEQLVGLSEVAIAANDAGERVIRTPAWVLKEGPSSELYAKPDDRWEANDVASRCPEIVDQLREHLETRSAGTESPLAEELKSVWR